MGELKKIATRNAYGEALKEFGADPRIVVLDADVAHSTMSGIFGDAYPERFFCTGIAEANMAGMAAGLASCGKIPFINSFAMFVSGRIYDQVRNSIAYPGLNVKIVASHAGITVGPDGATHQALEDIALMRALPGMTVLCPCDAAETRLMVQSMLEHQGPCYLRTGRLALEQVTVDNPHYRFQWGKAATLRQGGDVAILATGYMVAGALEAARQLEAQGVSAQVLDIHTIKPLDEAAVLEAAARCGALVTAEEHSIIGGLGSAVAELLSEQRPTPLVRVGTRDRFGHSGNPEELVARYNLAPSDIAGAARKALEKKKG